MHHTKITCWRCQQEYILQVPNVCWPCSSEKFLHELNKKPPFWNRAKQYTYVFLLSCIPAWLIGLYFGFWYEMAWIWGTIYMAMIPFVRDWLMSKF